MNFSGTIINPIIDHVFSQITLDKEVSQINAYFYRHDLLAILAKTKSPEFQKK